MFERSSYSNWKGVLVTYSYSQSLPKIDVRRLCLSRMVQPNLYESHILRPRDAAFGNWLIKYFMSYHTRPDVLLWSYNIIIHYGTTTLFDVKYSTVITLNTVMVYKFNHKVRSAGDKLGIQNYGNICCVFTTMLSVSVTTAINDVSAVS